VGHLDGGTTGERVAVKGQQAVAPVDLDHRRDGRPADLQRSQLGAEDAAAGVLGALLTHRQQSQEQLPGGHPSG
jgi:hypothetical protein